MRNREDCYKTTIPQSLRDSSLYTREPLFVKFIQPDKPQFINQTFKQKTPYTEV